MTRSTIAIALLGAALGVIPMSARAAVRTSCTKVRQALDSGKSVDEVAKTMKISADTVRHCQTTAPKPQAHK